MPYILIFYILLNIFSFFLYGLDKYKAKKEKWRIKENTLLFFSFLGIIGGLLGMAVFHHKTKKKKFRILLPLFLIAEVVFAYFLLTHDFS